MLGCARTFLYVCAPVLLVACCLLVFLKLASVAFASLRVNEYKSLQTKTTNICRFCLAPAKIDFFCCIGLPVRQGLLRNAHVLFVRLHACASRRLLFACILKTCFGRRLREGVFPVRAVQKSPCRTSRQGKRRMSFIKNYRLMVSSSSNMESAVVMIFDAAE